MRLWGSPRKALCVAKFRSLLIRLLAIVLLLQSGAAVGHCLRGMSLGEAMLIEICSTEGMRSIRLGAEGDPALEHGPGKEGGFCPVCHGLPGITLPEPPEASTPAWLSTHAVWHAHAAERLRPPTRAPPYSPRAPPVTA